MSHNVPRRAEMCRDELRWAKTSNDEQKRAETCQNEPWRDKMSQIKPWWAEMISRAMMSRNTIHKSSNPGDRSCHKSSKTLWQKLSQIFKHLSSKNLSWIRTGVDKKPTLYHAWLQGPTEHATSRGHKICSAAENPPCFRQKEVTRSTEWAHSLKEPSPRQNPGRPDSA